MSRRKSLYVRLKIEQVFRRRVVDVQRIASPYFVGNAGVSGIETTFLERPNGGAL